LPQAGTVLKTSCRAEPGAILKAPGFAIRGRSEELLMTAAPGVPENVLPEIPSL